MHTTNDFPGGMPAQSPTNTSGGRGSDGDRLISENRRWAVETLRATGQFIWRWSAPDSFLLCQRPGGLSPDAEHATPLTWHDLLESMDADERRRLMRLRHRVRNGAMDSLDFTMRPKADDRQKWCRVKGKVMARDDTGLPIAAIGTWEPISDRCCGEGNSRVRAHAFVASRDPMLVLDDDWNILEVNDAFVALCEAPAKQILEHRLDHYLQAEALQQAPSAIASGPRSRHYEGLFRAAGDTTIPIELTLNDFTPDDTERVHYIAALRDISDRKRSERELEHLASIDTLTQLPNRTTLQYVLKRRLNTASAQQSVAVLFIDLDGFKYINDSLGHQSGDVLLRIMVKRLRAILRSKDLVARWGGDEFVVVIDVGADDKLADRIAHRLLEALAQSMFISGHQISVTASIGIVHAPRDGRDSETLLKHADVAMYAAKERGKNAIVAYHEQLRHHNLEQISMLSRLREAIAKETLVFVVQPKFDGDSRVIGAELLARWHTDDYGHVPPSTFVPLAEHNGMASALGNLAIEHAARYAALLAAGGHPLPVAVNISALHVMDDTLSDTLRDACRRHGINTDQIELEVTESVFLENTRAPEERIEYLRRKGFRVAMDDFGAGYSSLGYLKRLPFDTIKIDRSFMSDLEADPRSRHLLAGIVGLCNLLGMETVAEGVETQEQWQLLQELGIKQYQGYYLGHPMEMKQLIELLGE